MQAGTFMIPYKLWSYWEGGLLEEFDHKARTRIMLRSEDVRDEEEVTVMEKYVEKYVKFYKSIFHHNNWYFWGFVVTEFLNFVILFVNFWIMNKFLQGKFWSFGSDVVKYELDNTNYDPYCKVFPLVTG